MFYILLQQTPYGGAALFLKTVAPVCVLAGETEMEALALGGVRMLTGEEQPNLYHTSDGKGKNK